MLTDEDKAWLKKQIEKSESSIKSEVNSEGFGCFAWLVLILIFINTWD